jgi:DegV family protein with EDD domain
VTVVVVTDASSRLPADLLEQWRIRVVPLHILLDGVDLRDGVDEIPDDIYKRHATTAAATPAELGAAYRQALADGGGDGVVAVHISSALSGTYGAAERAAAELGPAVRAIDSRSAAMGTGFVALAAARLAAAGADLDTVADAASSQMVRAQVVLPDPPLRWATAMMRLVPCSMALRTASRCCAGTRSACFWMRDAGLRFSAVALFAMP